METYRKKKDLSNTKKILKRTIWGVKSLNNEENGGLLDAKLKAFEALKEWRMKTKVKGEEKKVRRPRVFYTLPLSSKWQLSCQIYIRKNCRLEIVLKKIQVSELTSLAKLTCLRGN